MKCSVLREYIAQKIKKRTEEIKTLKDLANAFRVLVKSYHTFFSDFSLKIIKLAFFFSMKALNNLKILRLLTFIHCILNSFELQNILLLYQTSLNSMELIFSTEPNGTHVKVKTDIPDPFAGKVQTCGSVFGAEFGRPAENCTCNVRLTAVYNSWKQWHNFPRGLKSSAI